MGTLTNWPPPSTPNPEYMAWPKYAPNCQALLPSVSYSATTVANSGQEKEKMPRGLPYNHWLDPKLIQDRLHCQSALKKFNARISDQDIERGRIIDEERLQHFYEVLNPRPHGTRLIISPPFACMYGYNLKFGHDVVVERDCYIEDTALVTIGDRVTIGCGVHFQCMATSLDTRNRKGFQGTVCAGMIRVEDDVTIGAGVIIMPYRTLGSGCVVSAGSVVTKVS